MTEKKSITLYLAIGYDRHVDDTHGIFVNLKDAKKFCRDFMDYEGYERYGRWGQHPEIDNQYWLEFMDCLGSDAPQCRIETLTLDEPLEG